MDSVAGPARVTPGVLGYYRRKRSFDEQGRLICLEQWFEPAEEAPGQAGAEKGRADAE